MVNRIRAALVVVALVVVCLTVSGPAAAGGPTSALLSVPGQGKTASLYYTDPEYDALAALVGIEGRGAGGTDGSGSDHASGPGVTVTWLVHDVTPWRVDRIYPDGEGAAWIATQLAAENGSIWDSPVAWHRPDSGRELMRLLDRLGVGRAASTAGDFNGVAGSPVPPAAAAEPVAAEAVPAAEAADPAGIWWALGGLVVGILATIAGVRVRGRESADDVPDAEPDAAPTGTGMVVTEELSWPARRA